MTNIFIVQKLPINNMEPTKTQRLILFSLGQFYTALNQPLVQKLVQVRTSKIAFIEHLLRAKLISKQERALYKFLPFISFGFCIPITFNIVGATSANPPFRNFPLPLTTINGTSLVVCEVIYFPSISSQLP